MAEVYTFEDRTYMEPTVSRDEQLGFIDRLREIENKDLQKIATDTHNLGTNVPSNMGGLSGLNPNTGSAGIWRNRYERPQVNALVSGLRSTAQASALNTALNNMLGQYKNRYNQAYRNAKKAEWEAKSTDSEDPYDVKLGDDYRPAIDKYKAPEGWDAGSLYVVDEDGTIHSSINVERDANGVIGGVATPDGHYHSYGNAEGEENIVNNYLNDLINNGYTFLSPDGRVVKLRTGE